MRHSPFNQGPVTTINGKSGNVGIVSPDTSVIIGDDGMNDVTLETTGGGGGGTPYYAWAIQTTNTTMATGNGYIPNSSSLINYTIPASAAVGDHFKIVGWGTGGWKLKQSSGQTVHYSGTNTTTGTGGSIASQSRYDTIEIVCVVANTDFVVVEAQDSLTVV